MKACSDHRNAVTDMDRARDNAIFTAAVFEGAPDLFAVGVNSLDTQPFCCQRAGYARSLMKAAYRELFRGE